MSHHLQHKLESFISGHAVNEDDAAWLRGLLSREPRIEVDFRQDPPEPDGGRFPGFVQLAETLRRIQRSASICRDDRIAMSHAADVLAALPLNRAAPVVSEGFVLVQSPVTEAMHQAACKVLTRATGLDGLPQRMLDALAASAQGGKA